MDEQRLIDANNFPAKRLDPDECLCGRMYACGWNGVIHLIEDAHTIDPESLPIVQQLRTELAAARTAAFNLITAVEKLKTPRGKWVPFKSTHAGDIQYCSICGIGFAARTDFCPHCGADMRYYEEQDEEDEGDLNDRVNELGQSFLDGVQQALEWAKAKEGDSDESAQETAGKRLP